MAIKTIFDQRQRRQTVSHSERICYPDFDAGGSLSPQNSLRELSNQFVELSEDRRVFRTQKASEILSIIIEIEQERLDPFFVQIFPVRAVSGLGDIERIEHLLELPFHRPR